MTIIMSGQTPAEEDARASIGVRARERGERREERRLEAEELGAEVEGRLQFFPTTSFMASVGE